MTHSDFYVISINSVRGALTLFHTVDTDFYKVFRGEYIPENVIEFIPNCGKKTLDFLNSGAAGLHVVSGRIIELLKTNAITGWSSIPVKIKGYEKFEYYLFTITGRCSSINYEDSEPFMKQPFTPTGKPIDAKRGLYFNLSSWDGSDVFTPEDSMFTFVTEKVKKLLSEQNATNIILENITKFEIF